MLSEIFFGKNYSLSSRLCALQHVMAEEFYFPLALRNVYVILQMYVILNIFCSARITSSNSASDETETSESFFLSRFSSSSSKK